MYRADPSTGEVELFSEHEEWHYQMHLRLFDGAGGIYLAGWGGSSRTFAMFTAGVIDEPAFFCEESDDSHCIGLIANLASALHSAAGVLGLRVHRWFDHHDFPSDERVGPGRAGHTIFLAARVAGAT